MTPTQLRAFAAIVRLGSVKRAAAELAVSEAAVSLHVGQLRRELGDKLFSRTAAGLAFTPGGLRLASRATELLGLQDRTILEVSQARNGRRLLRVATSSMFAEHAAPGLIDLFTGRAADLDVELSVHRSADFAQLLLTRTVDVAIGPRPAVVDEPMLCTPFLNYELALVAHPEHPLTRMRPGAGELREQTWLLGPSAAAEKGLVWSILRRIEVPEDRQQIFQSHAAALEEAKRGRGVALVVSFAAAQELANHELKKIVVPALQAREAWSILTLADRSAPAAASELRRFVMTPRATQAMLRGSGVSVGRFRPSIHVTLWS
ncbi:LysR family transcriptional regulator [Jatrophihabitans cynanchi]|uniref:LysR family transcriptional regulator n=1 Tax=Jatrophihabitans cynanchi TaxID=2944128 RepID=A0ABY7JRV2_9ACTN|nr:LysR family transcriptional regulator [Jatrophihabitans sp. SB3-54]WAX55287.1 LysR family transcriptional regulator [Jatrophihabitans sp. SB3-54]